MIKLKDLKEGVIGRHPDAPDQPLRPDDLESLVTDAILKFIKDNKERVSFGFERKLANAILDHLLVDNKLRITDEDGVELQKRQ